MIQFLGAFRDEKNYYLLLKYPFGPDQPEYKITTDQSTYQQISNYLSAINSGKIIPEIVYRQGKKE